MFGASEIRKGSESGVDSFFDTPIDSKYIVDED